MRIAQVAPLFERVPPALYGGTERVVSYLTEALVRRGHEVVLFASGDSRTAARLVPCAPRALRLAGVSDCLPWISAQIGRVLELADEFDVIHSHVDHHAFALGRASATPVVHTLHGRLDIPDLCAVFDVFSEACLVSISDAQRRPFPGAGWVGTVYHGLASDLYPFQGASGGYLAFLGRISPEKRPDLAVQVARRAGLPLRIAAKVDAADRRYFEQTVAPLLDSPGVEFIGEIGEAEKGRFLGEAAALLAPIDWPEPFGMIFIEALACGTPVITRPCGSVPELLQHGVTAWIADDVDGLVEGVRRIGELDRARCRQEFLNRFTDGRMAADYERIYSALIGARRSRLDVVA